MVNAAGVNWRLNWTRFTVLLLVAVFALNVYRAATQSVAIDEAWTYNVFLAGPSSDLLTKFDAAHHILHTILAKLSISLLGLSELTLRLPSLLAGLLYLITSFRLCRRLFGQGWLLSFSFALLTMSPAVLDYMSAARGYGMALAFLLLAIWEMLNYDEGSGRLEWAALCLAASAAANLSFVFAEIPLALAFALALAREGRLNEAIDRFLVPGLVVAFSSMVLPLTHAFAGSFYAGMPTLIDGMDSVLTIFLFHDISGAPAERLLFITNPLVRWVFPAVLVVAIAACARRRPLRTLAPADRVLLLATSSAAGSVVFLVASHYLFGIPYPIRRTGLYLIPLLALVCLTLAAKVPRTKWRGAILAPGVAAGLACLTQFLGQLSVHDYAEWPYDFDTKRAVRKLIQDHSRHPDTVVTVGATRTLEPGLNFYRQKYRLHWMRPVEYAESVPAGDYYMLQGQDRALVEKLGLTKLYENDSALLVMAVPRR